MMNNLNMLELFGYVASVVTAVSLTMSSIIRLRWVNMAGSAMFCIYGFLIGALPVALLNLFIAFVNVYYLTKIYREKDHFSIIPSSADDHYLKEFINLNEKEIKKYNPGFSLGADNSLALMIHRNLALAGVFVAQKTDSKTLEVALDYVLPAYRDLKSGQFLFHENVAYFKQQGIERIVTKSNNKDHLNYLKKVGFTAEGDHFVFNV
ncbi:hypothetical protein EMN47_18415 [Prolixibacteraceae bacterium JC049]|nr:hypothetical protein [Prolixibacteraceae bacterium JC049]